MTPRIIFEDETLLVIEKPSGLVVDKSDTQNEGTLEDWLSKQLTANSQSIPKARDKQLNRQGIVHRLDKDTSGLLVVAKTSDSLEKLKQQFAERKVKKEYLALVHGLVESSGVVEGGIMRNPLKREKFVVSQEGKEAITEYEKVYNLQFTVYSFRKVFADLNKIQLRKLERMNYNQFTLLRCFPKTGRTHQIRVHLKYIGHPIVSDEKYAGRKIFRLDKRWCSRIFLHAAKLAFTHPVSGEWVEFGSELPEDLEKALRVFEGGHG